MIRDWLRRRLGITALEAQHRMLRGHVLYLDQWVRNLDTFAQELQKTNAPPDIKALAEKIRAQVMASKQLFPTRMDDVQR